MAYNGVLTLPSKRKSPSPAPSLPSTPTPPLELESIPSHGFFKLSAILKDFNLPSTEQASQSK